MGSSPIIIYNALIELETRYQILYNVIENPKSAEAITAYAYILREVPKINDLLHNIEYCRKNHDGSFRVLVKATRDTAYDIIRILCYLEEAARKHWRNLNNEQELTELVYNLRRVREKLYIECKEYMRFYHDSYVHIMF